MFREMRRFKQLLPQEAAVDILNRNTSGVLALTGDDNYPYAVPISYVYNDGKLYFHSAKSGHKIDAIKNGDIDTFNEFIFKVSTLATGTISLVIFLSSILTAGAS